MSICDSSIRMAPPPSRPIPSPSTGASSTPSTRATMCACGRSRSRIRSQKSSPDASVLAALKLEDPQTFSDEDLNDPAILTAVANGVEGAFQQVFDDVLVYTELLSDEIEETSTWLPWSDMSNGRIRGDWPTAGDFSGAQN